jgi:hypothetical protein
LFLLTTHVSLLTLIFVTPAFSQQRWERTYGGSLDDEGYSVQQTSDGGYIVAGMTTSFGNKGQVYLIKTNASGDTLWTKIYGGPEYDYSYAVQQTTDRGYIVSGVCDNNTANPQVYLIKTDSSGDMLWARTYGGARYDAGYSVQQTSDRGYIVGGYTLSFGNGSQVYLIKTNASGDTLWTRTYGDTGSEYGYSVQQTSDGGYIIAGIVNMFGNNDQVYLIKTNSFGDTLWTRNYGGAYTDWGESVQQTQDGGYIIAGFTNSFGPGTPSYTNVYLIKTNASGDTLWTRAYGGLRSDAGFSVKQTQDGGYIVAGSTSSFSDTLDNVYLIKTNASGDTLWTRTYGGADYDYAYSVGLTTDGGYIIAGVTGFDVYLIKTDANGNVGVETAGVRGQGLGVRITAKPNPFTAFSMVPGHEAERFNLYDIAGRKVGTYRGDRIGEGLGAGVYFLAPEGGKAKPVRIVKVK